MDETHMQSLDFNDAQAPQIHEHSHPQRALVLTGSRPPLLSDTQDVRRTFTGRRL